MIAKIYKVDNPNGGNGLFPIDNFLNRNSEHKDMRNLNYKEKMNNTFAIFVTSIS